MFILWEHFQIFWNIELFLSESAKHKNQTKKRCKKK